MQIYQKKADNLEQSPNYTVFNSLPKLTMSKFSFSSILAICLITFTTFLVTKTLEIQHSCSPMIYSGELPSQCQVASNDLNSRELSKSPLPKQTNEKLNLDNSLPTPPIAPNIFHYKAIARSEKLTLQPDSIATDRNSNSEIPNNSKTEPQTKTNLVSKTIDAIQEHPDDVVGVVAGASTAVAIGVAAGATAVLSVPVAGAVLIGLGVWVAVRSIF